MNIAHAGAAGLLAVLALAAGTFQPGPGLDATITSSIAPATAPRDSFRLVSAWGETECSLSTDPAAADPGTADPGADGAARPLHLTPGCVAANPELVAARYWLDRPDGTVALSGADGRIVAEFAMADGAAFESYYPQQPVMTLFADD